MPLNLNSLDRRRFLRGAGVALAIPLFETFVSSSARAAVDSSPPRRLACFYFPNGIPVPLEADPAHKDWNWFPHGSGRDFTFTRCLEPLELLRDEVTVLAGLSHPSVRSVHGHSNGDQYLTGGPTGGSGEYRNTISLDQVFAVQTGQHTRMLSLVMSTDGGTGTARGAQTMSFNRNGRAIPAQHKPKQIFDMLFVKNGEDAARRLAVSQSALDVLMADARSLRKTLSKHDQNTLDGYLQSVRDTEIKIAEAKRWMDVPLPKVDVDHLQLDITGEDPEIYVQVMFELIYLAFKTDSTRVATYQLGKEGCGTVSDYMARAVGLNLTHQLSHNTKKPGGWEEFGTYCRFLSEQYGRFVGKLKSTPEAGRDGNMLDNTLLLFGSASSAFHMSRNYPLILAGGKSMGFKHGQYLKYGKGNENNQAGAGASTDVTWRRE